MTDREPGLRGQPDPLSSRRPTCLPESSSSSSPSVASEMLPAAAAADSGGPLADTSSAPGSPTLASPHGSPPPKRSQACEKVYLIPTRLATVVLALLQGGVLDCYLTHYNSRYWFAWIAGDVAVVMMFAVAFVISYRQMTISLRRLLSPSSAAGGGAGCGEPPCGPGGRMCCVGVGGMGLGMLADKEDGGGGGGLGELASPGSMPLVYFAWLVYSSVLAIRVLLIYNNFAHDLGEGVFLGKNMLQMTVAMASIVFMLLLFAHHDASPESQRRHRIDNLTYLVAFDIVDASDLLGVLSTPSARDAMETWVLWSVLGVACLNLVLPTLPLMALSRTQFGARRLPEFLQTLHRLLVLLGVNVPLLATRLLLWHHVQLPVSTFLVKNIAVCFLVFYSFYERDHHKRLRDRLMEGHEMVG